MTKAHIEYSRISDAIIKIENRTEPNRQVWFSLLLIIGSKPNWIDKTGWALGLKTNHSVSKPFFLCVNVLPIFFLAKKNNTSRGLEIKTPLKKETTIQKTKPKPIN